MNIKLLTCYVLGDFLGVFAGVFFDAIDSPETFHLLGVLDKLPLTDEEAFFLDIFRLVLLNKKQNVK
jgi:hypothetical protein